MAHDLSEVEVKGAKGGREELIIDCPLLPISEQAERVCEAVTVDEPHEPSIEDAMYSNTDRCRQEPITT